MSDKLTKERFAEMCEAIGRRVATEGLYFGPLGAGLWKAIEADREAIRAETREELLKDHFKIGEAIIYDSATDGRERRGHVRIIDDVNDDGGDDHFIKWEHNGRRPPKKRAKSLSELSRELYNHLSISRVDELKKATILDLCRVYDVPTEVDE